jgi:hypothetical protein
VRDEAVSLLEMSGLFRVVEEEAGADYVLAGELQPDGRGGFVVRLQLFDRAGDRILEKGHGAAGELFRATRRAAGELFRELTGLRLAFGSLELVNRGEEGTYRLYLNGEDAGRDAAVLRKLLAGVHLVEIRQDRMFGPRTVFRGEAAVEEGGTARVRFSIPYLLPEERAAVDDLVSGIREREQDAESRGRVKELYRELIGLFGDVSYCPRLAELRETFRQRDAEYRLRAHLWDLGEQFYQPGRGVLAELVELYRSAPSYLDPKTVLDGVEANAGFLAAILELKAAYFFSNGMWAEGMELYGYLDRVASSLPLRPEMRERLEKNGQYLARRWSRYLRKVRRSETFADIGMSTAVGGRFRRSIRSAGAIFDRFEQVYPRELVVLTVPGGMKVRVNGSRRGESPLRLRREKEGEALVQVEDPWFEERAVDLAQGRSFLFASVTADPPLGPAPAVRDGRGWVLSWREIPRAAGYIVQVDEAGSNFSDPLYRAEVSGTGHRLGRRLGGGRSYWYRVRPITKEGLAGRWSYSAAFTAE